MSDLADAASLIEQAHDLAKRLHDRTGARYNGAPYFVHPQEVATRVARLSADPLAQVVAYLHDTVEDTPLTLDEIRRAFGDEVAEDVAALTRDKEREPYTDFVVRAARRPRARLVKYADLTANLAAFDDPRCTKSEDKRIQYEDALEYLILNYGEPASWNR